MTGKVRIALCQYKRDNPQFSQKNLIKWLEDNHNIKVSQATISTTLKRSAEILAKSNNETNLSAKCQQTVRYLEMESALVKWFRANQEQANVSGELVRESATKILDWLYLGHEPFEFSSGWLEAFKSRHGIRSYYRFGESGSVNMAALTNTLLAILITSSSASSSILSKVFPLISSLFWCHMYDVLVYKMLWDWKKILNISLWRIIRLSMRPTTGLCPHIGLERILVYTLLV